MDETLLLPREGRTEMENCVLVYAPVGQDGPMLAAMLQAAGIGAVLKNNLTSLCADLPDCMAALLTVEVLDGAGVELLRTALQSQPAWSDVPIVLLAGKSFPGFEPVVRAMGNVTVIPRPLSQNFLLSVVRSAIRARTRQYEVRDLLLESSRQQAHISALNARLQRSMHETHHRVKNNLQVIAALSELQQDERSDVVPLAAMMRIGQQTRVLAALHDLLTIETGNDAEVSVVSTLDMLERLIPLLRQAAGERSLEAEVEDFLLPIQESASLAMLVSEIVSNAVKHGRGTIAIRLHTEGAMAYLEVGDEGPGFPAHFSPARSGSTGLGLIDSTGRYDLRGTIYYENRPEGGAVVRVEFPITVGAKPPCPSVEAEAENLS